jgi:hypothetical protein
VTSQGCELAPAYLQELVAVTGGDNQRVTGWLQDFPASIEQMPLSDSAALFTGTADGLASITPPPAMATLHAGYIAFYGGLGQLFGELDGFGVTDPAVVALLIVYHPDLGRLDARISEVANTPSHDCELVELQVVFFRTGALTPGQLEQIEEAIAAASPSPAP